MQENNYELESMAQNHAPDIEMAKRFLDHLSQGEAEIFTFQIFDDRKLATSAVRPQIFHGTLEQLQGTFLQLQNQGAGVFVTINKTDGKGRKTENITAVRAVFVDLDGSPLGPILDSPLSPHIVIESSPGRFHAYWIVEGIELQLKKCPSNHKLILRDAGQFDVLGRTYIPL